MLESNPEHVVQLLSAASAVVFLLCLPVRLWRLRTLEKRLASTWRSLLQTVRPNAECPYFRQPLTSLWQAVAASLSLYLLGSLLKLGERLSEIDAFAAVSLLASLAAALSLGLLLTAEQAKTGRPSDIATLYLLASVGCDVLLATLPSGDGTRAGVSSPVLVRLVSCSALLGLETTRPPGQFAGQDLSPEECSGVLSRVFFTWINPTLVRGYQKILAHKDIPRLRRDMKPALTREVMIRRWDQRGMPARQAKLLSACNLTTLTATPETKWTLPLALLRCIRAPFLAAIAPRVFLIVFRYSQPLLIKESIRFVATPPESLISMRGYWLIVSAVAIYLGLAVCTVLDRHSNLG